MKKNYVALLLDASGSMSSLRAKALECLNRTLRDLKENSKTTGQKTYVTLITFNDKAVVHFKNVDSANLVEYKNYLPNSGTALIDAVLKATDLFGEIKYTKKDDVSFLVMTITDGQENSSKNSHIYFGDKLMAFQGTDRWTFTFQVPKGYSSYITGLGVFGGNVQEWDTNEHGLEQATNQNTFGLSNYYNQRSLGKTSLQSFYTDLSGVNNTVIKKNLHDVSQDYKLYNVSEEDEIRDFVENKTKKPYNKGCAFYQLMKKELVQHDKEVLVQDKKNKHIYAGQNARSLIGIPDGQDVKVEPGNHGNYEIFVQSNSVNRKLPRGTKVLVRK